MKDTIHLAVTIVKNSEKFETILLSTDCVKPSRKKKLNSMAIIWGSL